MRAPPPPTTDAPAPSSSSSSSATPVVELPTEIWETIVARIVRSETFRPYYGYDPNALYPGGLLAPNAHRAIAQEEHQARWRNERAVAVNGAKATRCGETIVALRATCREFRRVMNGPVGREVCREGWEAVLAHCSDPYLAFLGVQFHPGFGRMERVQRRDRAGLLDGATMAAPTKMTRENKLALWCGKACQICGNEAVPADQRDVRMDRGVRWSIGARVCTACLQRNCMAPPKPGRDAPVIVDGQPMLEEHYKSLTPLNVHGRRVYWRNSVLKNMERTKERQRRLEEQKRARKRLAVKTQKKEMRDKVQAVRDAIRDKRRADMDAILFNHVIDGKYLELSETYRKHAAMARPLTHWFRKTYLRKILNEIPENFRQEPPAAARKPKAEARDENA